MFLFPTLIALIVDAYDEVKKDEKSIVNKGMILKLVEEWKEVDEEAKGYIPYESFWQFYLQFQKIKKEKSVRLDLESKQRILERLDLTVYESEGQYWFGFHEVIGNLIKMYLESKLQETIIENDAHKNFEQIYVNDKKELVRTDTKSGKVPELAVLRSMLRRWQ